MHREFFCLFPILFLKGTILEVVWKTSNGSSLPGMVLVCHVGIMPVWDGRAG